MKRLAGVLAAILLALAGLTISAAPAQAHDWQTLHNSGASDKTNTVQSCDTCANAYISIGTSKSWSGGYYKTQVYVHSGCDVKVDDNYSAYYNIFTSTGWHKLPWFANGFGDDATLYEYC